MRLKKTVLAVAMIAAGLLGLAPLPATADDDPEFLRLAVGRYDINDDQEAFEFRAEYQSDRVFWIFKPIVGLMATTDGAAYGYGGFATDFYFGRRIVLSPSIAAGLYLDGDGKDLGHIIEFRSSIELAYRFNNRSRIGVSFYHLSNASIGSANPGTEILSLTYSIPFNTGR